MEPPATGYDAIAIPSHPCTTGAYLNSRVSVSPGRWPRSTPTTSTGIRLPGWCSTVVPPGSRSASSADTDRSPTLIAVLMMWSAGSPMKLNPCCRQAQPVQQPTAPSKFTADDRTQQ